MESIGRVRVLSCLFLVAAFTLSYTQVQLDHRPAAFAFAFAFAAPSRGASTPAFLSKRVDLLHRSGSSKREVSISELLRTDHHRIAVIHAKLHHARGAASSDEPISQQSSTQTPLYSGETIGSANYIVKVGLGTPAKDLHLAIDTGSSLSWTQCLPCGPCYAQNDPIFNPSASSSYQKVPCTSPQCAKLSSSSSSGSCSSTKATTCDYVIIYLDGSLTFGDFALEALTVGDRLVSAAFPIGCGHENEGLFNGLDGLLGLSRDSIAFPAQTKGVFGEVFAYCMPPIFSSSAGYIEFGVAGGGASTPLIGLGTSELYVVELESVQVEGTTSMRKPSTSKVMVVDSGTVITRLDSPLYVQVRDAFKKAASSLKEAPLEAGMGLFETCYIASNANLFPSITFTFKGGLAFTPSAQNLVIPMDSKETYCLALLPIDSSLGVSIFGNYQQQGHLFTFDIAHSTLSISSNAC